MHAYQKSTKRFSLLLLEDEEDYVQDWVVTCYWPETVKGNWQKLPTLPGRLRLCTKSLFFDPDDIRIPIIRLPFRNIQVLDTVDRSTIKVSSELLVKMKHNMEDAPYLFEKGQSSSWRFTLSYAPLDSFIREALPLLDAAKLQPVVQRKLLEAGVQEREAAVSFDSSRLVDFCERVLYDGGALQLTPLVREPGRLVITDQRIYFQALYNVAGSTPVRSHPLSAVAAVARRRSSLRPIGLELFFIQQDDMPDGEAAALGPTWDGASAFFAFRSEDEREKVARVLLAQECLGAAVPMLASCDVSTRGALLEAHGRWVSKVLVAWQHGKISNFDYLMYLNLAAGRSFNELAQWPVFPWILANYRSQKLDLNDPANFRDLSKPVGALNPERLQEFRQRYREMPAGDPAEGGLPPFLYGTHYSTPGYVMFWLVRAAPAHMLRLQSGRFDSPDRLFCSMAECWDGVLQSSSDVKELIPEFFLPDSRFLVNSAHLPLGVRQNGKTVGDVELPPWADTPLAFLSIMRAALESPCVSSQLHLWIDLIFGYKQQGRAAVGADNVFYYLTYEGAVDVSKVDDPIELKALETQINEFGQTPKQLFVQPHPARTVNPPAPDPNTVFDRKGSSSLLSPVSTSDSEDPTRSTLALTLISTIMAAATEEPPSDFILAPPHKPPAPPALIKTIAPADLSPTPLAHYVPLVPTASISSLDSLSNTPVGTPMAGSAYNGNASWLRPDSQASYTAQSTGQSNYSTHFTSHSTFAAQPLAQSNNAMQSNGQSTYGTQSNHPIARGRSAVGGLSGELGPSEGTISTASESVSSEGSLGSRLSQALQDRLQDFTRRGPTASNVMDSFKGRSAVSNAGTAQPSTPLPRSWSWRSRPTSSGGRPPPPPPPSTSTSTSTPLISPRQHPSPSAPRSWCSLFSSSLSPLTHKQLQRKPLTVVQCADGVVYCVGDAGMLRVLNLWDLAHIRAMNLPGSLMSLALLPQAPSSAAATNGTAVQPAAGQYPLMLSGSHNKMVFAYSVEAGKLAGSFCAHDDAVSVIKLVGQGATGGGGGAAANTRMATASYDCTFKLWSLSEGRHPWSPGSEPLPELEVNDLDSAIWAMDINSKGSLLVTGTEVGVVTAWDLRSGREIWHSALSDNYISSVNITPCGNYVVVGAGDSQLSLLEWRRAGMPCAAVPCEAPICCCSTDGDLVIAGTEQGGVEMWSLAHTLKKESSRTLPPPGNDGCYPVLRTESSSACNSVFAGLLCSAPDGDAGSAIPYMVTAHSDGELCAFLG